MKRDVTTRECTANDMGDEDSEVWRTQRDAALFLIKMTQATVPSVSLPQRIAGTLSASNYSRPKSNRENSRSREWGASER